VTWRFRKWSVFSTTWNAPGLSSSSTVTGCWRDWSRRETASAKGEALENILLNTGDAAHSTCEATRYWADRWLVFSLAGDESQMSRRTSPSGAKVISGGIGCGMRVW